MCASARCTARPPAASWTCLGAASRAWRRRRSPSRRRRRARPPPPGRPACGARPRPAPARAAYLPALAPHTAPDQCTARACCCQTSVHIERKPALLCCGRVGQPALPCQRFAWREHALWGGRRSSRGLRAVRMQPARRWAAGACRCAACVGVAGACAATGPGLTEVVGGAAQAEARARGAAGQPADQVYARYAGPGAGGQACDAARALRAGARPGPAPG